jgi:hypothetical protein
MKSIGGGINEISQYQAAAAATNSSQRSKNLPRV